MGWTNEGERVGSAAMIDEEKSKLTAELITVLHEDISADSRTSETTDHQLESLIVSAAHHLRMIRALHPKWYTNIKDALPRANSEDVFDIQEAMFKTMPGGQSKPAEELRQILPKAFALIEGDARYNPSGVSGQT